MTPQESGYEQPQSSQREGSPESGSARSGPTVNQRMGLAVLSLAFLVFMINVMASLSSSFGPSGSAIGLVAVCLTVLGINVAFNMDVFRQRQ